MARTEVSVLVQINALSREVGTQAKLANHRAGVSLSARLVARQQFGR